MPLIRQNKEVKISCVSNIQNNDTKMISYIIKQCEDKETVTDIIGELRDNGIVDNTPYVGVLTNTECEVSVSKWNTQSSMLRDLTDHIYSPESDWGFTYLFEKGEPIEVEVKIKRGNTNAID